MTGLLVVVAAVLGQVTLRGGESLAPGEVVRVDAAGVLVGPAGAEKSEQEAAPGQVPAAAPKVEAGGQVLVGWDRVKSVRGASAEEAEKFAPIAELAWRARARVERGDLVSAEPLLERLFEAYRGTPGPTAAVIAEGLMRCRVRRAAHVAAVEPWLALLASRQGAQPKWLHGEWASEAGLGSIIDEGTGLAPSLPPIWLNWPSVAGWARGQPLTTADPRSAALAVLYHAAAKHEAGMDTALPGPTADPGVQIVADIVAARMGTPEQREAARQRLAERIKPATPSTPGAPAWLEAWCRAAIGRSLVKEEDPERRRLGVVELLHVPARFGGTHPYLAGVALAEASATLAELGDSAGAAVLARELETNYPTHPVRDWEGMRRGGAPAASPGAIQAPAGGP